jgi:hypothetical protein
VPLHQKFRVEVRRARATRAEEEQICGDLMIVDLCQKNLAPLPHILFSWPAWLPGSDFVLELLWSFEPGQMEGTEARHMTRVMNQSCRQGPLCGSG